MKNAEETAVKNLIEYTNVERRRKCTESGSSKSYDVYRQGLASGEKEVTQDTDK